MSPATTNIVSKNHVSASVSKDMFLKKELLQNERVEAKIMRKIPIIIIALITLIAGLLSGCTQDSNTGLENSNDTDYIIGSWINITNSINSTGVNEPLERVFNFTDNMFNYSFYTKRGSNRYYSSFDGTYELKDGNLIITNTTRASPVKITFKYSFSNNYTTLTLTSESKFSNVYTKIK